MTANLSSEITEFASFSIFASVLTIPSRLSGRISSMQNPGPGLNSNSMICDMLFWGDSGVGSTPSSGTNFPFDHP